MAVEADSVVVELVAKTDGFDAKMQGSSRGFQTAVADIGKAATSTEKVLDNLKKKMADALSAGDQAKATRLSSEIAQIEGALGRVNATSGRTRMGMQQLGFQMNDVATQMAMGTKATTIFAQQSGQMIQALQMMGGEGSAFLKFLGGPWGIGLSVAAIALTPLIGKLFDSSDAVGDLVNKLKEHAEKTRDSEQADRIWAGTLDGLIERQKQLNAELDKRLTTQAATDATTLAGAQSDRDRLKNELDAAERDLANKKEELDRAKDLARNALDPSAAQGAAAALARAQEAFTAAQTKVNNVSKAYSEAASNVSKGLAVAGEAQSTLNGLADHFTGIIKNNNKVLIDQNPTLAAYSKSLYGAGAALEKAMGDAASANVPFSNFGVRAEQLQKQLSLGQITVKTYTTEIQKMAKALENSADAAKKTAKETGELTKLALPVQGTITGRFGEQRPGHRHAGVDIAVPVGTPVKAPAGGTVIEAGTLPGYGNVVFIDHGGGTISRLAHLSQIGVTRGQQVAQGAVIGLSGGAKGAPGSGDSTGPHVHFEVRSGGKAVDPLKGTFATDAAGVAAKAQNIAEELAQKQIQSDLDFAKKSADLDAKILAAKDDQVQDELARIDISEQRIRAEQQSLDTAIDADAQAKKAAGLDAATADAQAKMLHEKNEQLANEKIATAELLRKTEIAKRAHEAEDQRYEFAIGDLKASEQLATSLAERRQIELELLDLKYEQKVADLEYLKEQALRNGKLHDANLIQQQIDHLPYEKGAEAVGIEMSTMGPLQSFLKDIPHDAKAVNEALQGIAVDGLKSVVDGLGEASVAWIKMGGTAGQIIKGLISKIITLILYQQIAALFGSKMPVNPFGGGAPIVNLGADTPLGGYGTAPTIDVGSLPTFASGGTGIIGGFGGTDNNLLSLNNDPIAWVSRGEKLSISNATAASGFGGAQGMVLVRIAASPYFDGRVLEVTGPVIAQASTGAAQGGASLARDNLARRSLHQLEY